MASIEKTASGYRARWRTPEGASRSKTFKRKADAERYLVEIEHHKNVGAYVDPRAGRVTFGAFAKRWLVAQTFDESTREAVASRLRKHILPAFGRLELRSIRPSTVQAWLRGRQEQSAPRYVRVMLANVSAIPCSGRRGRTHRPQPMCVALGAGPDPRREEDRPLVA